MAKVVAESGASSKPREASDPLAPLLAATAEGDRDAFAELYRLTSARLMCVALKMLNDRELAEEVLQESFLAVWQKARLYRTDHGAALAWLTTLVRHRAIDRLRLTGGSRELAVGADTELEPYAQAMTGTAESGIVIAQSILRCMEGLKEKQQRFIALAFYHGLTHEELSEQSGTPLGTVKSDMRRGLAGLRECLER